MHVLCGCSAGHRGCPQEAHTLRTSGNWEALQKKELREQKEVNLEVYIIGAGRGEEAGARILDVQRRKMGGLLISQPLSVSTQCHEEQ